MLLASGETIPPRPPLILGEVFPPDPSSPILFYLWAPPVIELRQELARASAMLDVKRFDVGIRAVVAHRGGGAGQCPGLVPDGPRPPGACLVRRGHRGGVPRGGPGPLGRVAAPPGQQRAGPPGQLLQRAARGARGVPARRPATGRPTCAWRRPPWPASGWNTATDAAARARALAPNEPDVHFLSGKVSLSRGDLAAAREHQERALALDPAHSGAMNELGRIRLRRNYPIGAIRHFLSAARSTPDERIYAEHHACRFLESGLRIPLRTMPDATGNPSCPDSSWRSPAACSGSCW